MFQVFSEEKSGRSLDQQTFEHSVGTSTTNHSGDPPGQIQTTFTDISFHNLLVPSTTSDNLPAHSDDSLTSTVWPTFLNFPTEFEDGSWKCPLCTHTTPRIRQHFTKSHKDDIKDWRAVETFCDEKERSPKES